MEGKHVVNRTFPSLALVPVKPHDQKDVVPIEAPIVSSYNDRIRPLLDTVDKLRNLSVMKEGIQLPTIVVVGDQSSGKSSVLESLAGISLPRGQGICTRVPLVMRLQQSSSPEPEIWLEYDGKDVPTDEEHITKAICAATDVIAGSGKGVSDAPLTHCKQRWFKIHEQTNNFNTATKRKPAAAGSQASSSNVENYERRPEGIKAAKAKRNNARSTNMKALAEYKSMWDIKKKDMAEKEKLQKLAILDTLLAKKEPLSATEEVIMSKIVSQYF